MWVAWCPTDDRHTRYNIWTAMSFLMWRDEIAAETMNEPQRVTVGILFHCKETYLTVVINFCVNIKQK